MAGISAETCISLILSRIGGIPLRPATAVSVEGSPPAKQLGGISTSFTSLTSMSQSLSGMSIPEINAGIFQNPIASATSTLNGSITSGLSSLQSMAGTFDPMTGSYSGGSLSLDQVNALTMKLNGSTLGSTLDPATGMYSQVTNLGTGGLAGGLSSLKDHTDKMSGLKVPNYENAGEFGFLQLTSMQSSMNSMTKQIPDGLNTEVGGIKDKITDKMTAVSAPLEMGPSLASVTTNVNSISELSSLSGAALTAKYDQILASVTSGEASVNSVVSNSKSSMTALVNATDAASYPAVAVGVISSGEAGPVKNTIDKVVQTGTKTRIESDLKKYAIDES